MSKLHKYKDEVKKPLPSSTPKTRIEREENEDLEVALH